MVLGYHTYTNYKVQSTPLTPKNLYQLKRHNEKK